MKKRYLFWDNYKGILIFLVVLGHFLYDYAMHMNGRLVDDIFTFIYTFHMPVFIFCSGYLSKSEKSRSKKSLMQLLVYYILFNTIMMFFAYFINDSRLKLLTPYYSYWYILALIIWRVSINYLSKIKWIVPLSFLISLLLGYWSEFTNLLAIRRAIAFFIFFLLGYNFKKEKFEEFITTRNWKHYIVGTLFTIIVSIGTFYVVDHHNITLSMLLMDAYDELSEVLVRLFILGVSFCMIIGMLMIVPNRKIPILTTIGKNSLLIYLVHRFVTLIYSEIFTPVEYTPIHLLYVFVLSILTCVVLGNEKLNQTVSHWLAHITDLLLDFNSKEGNRLRTAVLVIVIIILSLDPLIEICSLL